MPKQKPYISNLLYFQASSMKALYEYLKNWQEEYHKPFLGLSIHQDGDSFCCIATIDPDDLRREFPRSEYEEAMARFERKALRIIVKEENIGAIVEFEAPIISEQKILAIQKRLMECATAMEVRTVFEEEL